MSKKVYNKEWLDRRSRKLGKKRHCKKKSLYSNINQKNSYNKDRDVKRKSNFYESHKIAPVNFSFLNNTEQTIDYFNDVVLEILQKESGKCFFIDSSNVESVTVDALTYLIAIMKNMRLNYVMKYAFRGNLPGNCKAAAVYQESGFMSFVKSKMRELPSSTDKMKIVSGTKNDPQVASKFCKFVMEKLNKEMLDILSLQKVLIELMSNVYHHAYNNDGEMNKHWYIYAEYADKHVRFVFVDTGAGIARTVRKKWIEKMKKLFGTKVIDSDLISSTLRGDFRTQTKEKFRGNGLSGVRELAESSLFEKFTVISGKGQCTVIDGNTPLTKFDYNNKIYGTIYIFDVV